jgi:hypothetical protein
MNDSDGDPVKSVSEVLLTSDERQAMRRTLEVLTQTHAVRRGPFAFVFRHALVFSILVLVILAGGATGLAQQANPGDRLYGMKLRVNDRAQGIFMFGEDAEIDLEIKQMERILTEEEFSAERELAYEDSDNYLSIPQQNKSPTSTELQNEIEELYKEAEDIFRDVQELSESPFPKLR